MTRVLAVDLGATSVRVAAVDLSREPTVDVLHRWHHSPIADENGSLRWDWAGILEHVERGLTLGLEAGPVSSIGVDGWGVDYGLIDASGDLVDLPYAYRDARTQGWETTAAAIGVQRLYEITGVQLMGLNTIFQLAADPEARLDAADKLLLLPDLLVHHLTGWVGCELSNMSTTGLMDARDRRWSRPLTDAIGVPAHLFPEPARASTSAGTWHETPVHLVGSHDTASAFLGVPLDPATPSIFVSTGSWVIVGVERPEPNLSDRARELNFSNEAGALGGVRLLKNVVGFWILEQCRSAWGNPSVEELIAEASSVDGDVPEFDARDHRFVNTNDMVTELTSATGLGENATRPLIVRSIIESIVSGVVRVIEEIRELTDEEAKRVLLVGGGSRIPLVGELIGQRAGLEVVTGSPEATALGNALVQGIALGTFANLEEGRRWLTPSGVAA